MTFNNGTNIINPNINTTNTKINMIYFDGETILVTMRESTMVYHDGYYKPKGIIKPWD